MSVDHRAAGGRGQTMTEILRRPRYVPPRHSTPWMVRLIAPPAHSAKLLQSTFRPFWAPATRRS